ncbi:MAG: hypothetical protein IPQ14_12245 [Candidatus Microthrix sp.]|uniref:hypothetical protein n=1 Tax=Candidatus Neomicrothrix sp. TaxID=2719034 RepID=UPI0025C3C657|nr:hypothetical protein [Candidatus Microthrix sp.]MBL0205062.1 hypothetical protein [Candidatus Microthrix sp.]
MTRQTGTYPVELGFLPDAFAIPDVDHPGLLRAGERGAAPYGGESVEHHDCPATDCNQVDQGVDLLNAGFDTVDLTPFAHLQSVLERVDEARQPERLGCRSGAGGAGRSCAAVPQWADADGAVRGR